MKVENTTTSTNTSTETVNTTGTTTGTNTNTNTDTQVPVKPKGTLAGQVVKSNLTPLSGATVELTIGTSIATTSVTTGMDGRFAFTGIPAGSSVMVSASMANYGVVRMTGTIPSTAGNSPLDDANLNVGTLVLAELDGRQSFRVVLPTGAAATGAKANLAISSTGYSYAGQVNVTSRMVVEAAVDANGILAFSGIPKPSTPFLQATYSLSVEPLDINADGIPDTSGFYNDYAWVTLLNNQALPVVVLPFPQSTNTLLCEASNVQSLCGTSSDPIRNLVKLTDAIRITFNQPIQPGSIDVKLTDETARDKITTTVALSSSGNTVTITPAANSIRVGQEYNIAIRAVSQSNGSLFARTGFFFGGDITMPQAPALARVEYIDRPSDATIRQDNRLDPGETIVITFNSAVARTGSALVEAFFDADTDGNTSVGGNTLGELGNNSSRGFSVFPLEPTAPTYTGMNPTPPQFPILSSGYTTRYVFTYPGSVPLSSSGQLFLKFSFLPFRSADGYETIWATPITADLNSTLTSLPQQTVLQ